MKRIPLFLAVVLLLGTYSFAQFGPDVTILSPSGETQRDAVVATAFNGWLYSAFITVNSGSNSGGITVRRSTDKGVSWQTVDAYAYPGKRFLDVDIEVVGTSVSSLEVYVLGIQSDGNYELFMDKYNGNTLAYMSTPVTMNGTDAILHCDLTTDYEHVSYGAGPYSLGIIYSKRHSPLDSIACFTSADGGVNFHYEPVTATSSYCGEVSISYAYSGTYTNGRWAATWIERADPNNAGGNVLYSRTEPYINYPWQAPTAITNDGKWANARIATSYGTQGNSNNDMTAMIFADFDYYGNQTDWDLKAFTTTTMMGTPNWATTLIAGTSDIESEADVIYDPNGNNFHFVFSDFSAESLIYYTNDLNLGGWNLAAAHFNDIHQDGLPFPRLSFSQVDHKIGCIWTSWGYVALFDAAYSPLFVGVADAQAIEVGVTTYPNPTAAAFQVSMDSHVGRNMQLLDMSGKVLLRQETLSDGETIDMSSFASGNYFLSLEVKGRMIVKKIVKQ